MKSSLSAHGLVGIYVLWNLDYECTRSYQCLYVVKFTVWVHKALFVCVWCRIYSLSAQGLVGVCCRIYSVSAQGIVAACIVWNLQSECTRPGWCMYAVEFTVWVHKTWLVCVFYGVHTALAVGMAVVLHSSLWAFWLTKGIMLHWGWYLEEGRNCNLYSFSLDICQS